MDLLCGLRVTKGHRGHVLQDGHLHRAVPAVQQRHQGPGVHGPIHDRRSDACNDSARRSAPCWDLSPPSADMMQPIPRTSSSVQPAAGIFVKNKLKARGGCYSSLPPEGLLMAVTPPPQIRAPGNTAPGPLHSSQRQTRRLDRGVSRARLMFLFQPRLQRHCPEPERDSAGCSQNHLCPQV